MFYNSFSFTINLAKKLKGITIDFWVLSYTEEFISNYYSYKINLNDNLIILFNPSKLEVKYKNENTIQINESLLLFKWNYIKITIDFMNQLKVNLKSAEISIKTFPKFNENTQINFINILPKIDSKSSLFIKEFKIWKIIVPDSFIVSNK